MGEREVRIRLRRTAVSGLPTNGSGPKWFRAKGGPAYHCLKNDGIKQSIDAGSGQEGGKALRVNGEQPFPACHGPHRGGEANHRPHEQQENSRRRMLEVQKKPNKVKR